MKREEHSLESAPELSGAGRRSRTSRRAASSPLSDDPLWYKDAIIYQVHVKSFFDANNDGVGDFAGLIA
ncbi:MAG: hypothetical protein ACTHKH_19075, partial [Trinickia sp.]